MTNEDAPAADTAPRTPETIPLDEVFYVRDVAEPSDGHTGINVDDPLLFRNLNVHSLRVPSWLWSRAAQLARKRGIKSVSRMFNALALQGLRSIEAASPHDVNDDDQLALRNPLIRCADCRVACERSLLR